MRGIADGQPRNIPIAGTASPRQELSVRTPTRGLMSRSQYSRGRDRTTRRLCVALALAAAEPLRAQIPAGSTTPARDSLLAGVIGGGGGRLANGVVGADILVFRLDSIRTISVDSGAFRLGGIPAGTIVFNVRRIGYEPASFTAVLHGGRT